MMDIFDTLAKDPDQMVQVANDDTARNFLDRLRIADAFTDGGDLADTPTLQILGFDGHATHFIIAFLFSGLPAEKDNGLLVTCLPKSGFEPGISSDDFVKGAIREQSEKGLRVIRRNTADRN